MSLTLVIDKNIEWLLSPGMGITIINYLIYCILSDIHVTLINKIIDISYFIQYTCHYNKYKNLKYHILYYYTSNWYCSIRLLYYRAIIPNMALGPYEIEYGPVIICNYIHVPFLGPFIEYVKNRHFLSITYFRKWK